MSTKKNKIKLNIYLLPIIFVGFLTAIDQLTKYIITSKLALYETIPVIKDVFAITYIQNEGVAWGMFQGGRIIFLILTILVLLMCFYIYSNIAEKREFLPLRIGIIVLMAGALGNMIDRINLGYVVDFLSFELINFPVFNVADIYVVISMIFVFILIAFKYNDDDIDTIIGIKAKKKSPEVSDDNKEDNNGNN